MPAMVGRSREPRDCPSKITVILPAEHHPAQNAVSMETGWTPILPTFKAYFRGLFLPPVSEGSRTWSKPG